MEKVSGTLSNVPGISTYENLKDKPQINGVELFGNKSAEDLGLATKLQLEKMQTDTTESFVEFGETLEELQQQTQELQKTIAGFVDGNEVSF